MLKTGIVREQTFLLHDPGPVEPETLDRLRAVHAMLNEEEMVRNSV